MAATIAEVSGGRFVLGLGAGWNETEYRAFGLPYDHRVSRFEESFEIVRRLLAGERVTLAGRFWQAEDAVLLPRPPGRVPLMIGSNGERMLAATLPHVDRWNTWYAGYGNTVEGFAELNARIGAAARGCRPRPGGGRAQRCVLVELDPDAVRRPHSDEGMEPVTPERLARSTCAALERGGRRRGDPGPAPDHRGVDQGDRAAASQPRSSREPRVVADRAEVGVLARRFGREGRRRLERRPKMPDRLVGLAEQRLGAGEVVVERAPVLVALERVEEQLLRLLRLACVEEREDVAVRLPRNAA